MHRVSIFVVATIASGCVADSGNESFLIRNNLANEGDACDFMPDLTSPFIPRGQLFLDSPIPYVLTPLIESRITAGEGRESLRTVILKGARIDLTIGPIETIDAAGNVTTDTGTELLQFESLFSAALPPNGGLTFAAFDLVPLAATSSIRARAAGAARVHAQVTGTMRAFGDFYGQEIESEPFTYPVTVCSDCVLGNIFAACPAPTGAMVRTGNGCNPFQDGIVDCCVDAVAGLVCPAPAL
jgi:hypothetical protein